MSDVPAAPAPPESQRFVIRLPQVFEHLLPQLEKALGLTSVKNVGPGYWLVSTTSPDHLRSTSAGKLIRWCLPVEHSWPCNPAKMDRFIERAAIALRDKFGSTGVQGVFIGPLGSGEKDSYFRLMASNLRGRLLQLFPATPVSDPLEQDAAKPSLFCLVGRAGLFAGVISPRQANGFFPGGTRFMRISGDDVISRASGKIAEALHYLTLYRRAPEPGSRWLEIGAAPGGMTTELLSRDYAVTAVDTASMDPAIARHPNLTHIKSNIADFQAYSDGRYQALLCDLNNTASESMAHVARLARGVEAKGIVVFTLKLSVIDSLDAIISQLDSAVDAAKAGGLRLVAATHLNNNRHELTLFLQPRNHGDDTRRRK